jgi:hypothetical protein
MTQQKHQPTTGTGSNEQPALPAEDAAHGAAAVLIEGSASGSKAETAISTLGTEDFNTSNGDAGSCNGGTTAAWYLALPIWSCEGDCGQRSERETDAYSRSRLN